MVHFPKAQHASYTIRKDRMPLLCDTDVADLYL